MDFAIIAGMLLPGHLRRAPRPALGLALSVILGVACKDDAPCEPCDAKSEYCAVFGSDVAGVSSTFSCVALPSACTEDPSCECLETVDDEDSNLDVSLSFCLLEGKCSDEDPALRVDCPGG